MDNDIQFIKEPKGTYLAEIQFLESAPKEKDTDKKNEHRSKSPTKTQKRELDQAYSAIFTMLEPQTGTKGSKMNLNVLRCHIEEMYSTRFLEDTKAMANQNAEIIPFPEFFVNYLAARFKKKSQLDQMTINILSSVEFYSKNHKDIKIFSKFLSEEYDSDDLIFYLFVRSCIEKELKMLFVDKARQNANSMHDDPETNEIYVPQKSSANIGLKIFGKNEEVMLNNFKKKVAILYEKESLHNKHEMVKASSIMAFSLEDYHSKNNDEEVEEDEEKLVSSFNGLDENAEKFDKKIAIEEKENQETEFLVETTKAPETTKTNANNKNATTTTVEATNETTTRSDVFTSLCKKYKIEKCKNEAEKIMCLKNIVNSYITEKELGLFFVRLIGSTPVFSKNEAKIKKNLGKVKSFATQRFSLLISMIFQKDKKKFLTLLSLKENSQQGNKYYSTLVSFKDQMLKTQPFSNLDEGLLTKFIKAVTDIPENVSQISKMISKIIS